MARGTGQQCGRRAASRPKSRGTSAVCNVAFGPRSSSSRIGRTIFELGALSASNQNVPNHTTIDIPTVSKTPLTMSEGGPAPDVLLCRPLARGREAKCNVSCGGGFDEFGLALW